LVYLLPLWGGNRQLFMGPRTIDSEMDALMRARALLESNPGDGISRASSFGITTSQPSVSMPHHVTMNDGTSSVINEIISQLSSSNTTIDSVSLNSNIMLYLEFCDMNVDTTAVVTEVIKHFNNKFLYYKSILIGLNSRCRDKFIICDYIY
jgi:hypothetical protein